MSDTRQKNNGGDPAHRGPRPAGRTPERRSFHEESRSDRHCGRRPAAPRRQYSSFAGEQPARAPRRPEEFSGWSRAGQREVRTPRDGRLSPWQMDSELLPALPDVVRREQIKARREVDNVVEGNYDQQQKRGFSMKR